MSDVAYTAVVRRCQESGRYTLTSDDIRGLVMEADSVADLEAELPTLAEELLRSNHGLTDWDLHGLKIEVIDAADNDDWNDEPDRSPEPDTLPSDI